VTFFFADSLHIGEQGGGADRSVGATDGGKASGPEDLSYTPQRCRCPTFAGERLAGARAYDMFDGIRGGAASGPIVYSFLAWNDANLSFI